MVTDPLLAIDLNGDIPIIFPRDDNIFRNNRLNHYIWFNIFYPKISH